MRRIVMTEKNNEDLINFMIYVEDKRKSVYPDSGGEPTIGVGHLLTASERRSGKILINGSYVKYSQGLTDKEIFALLMQDLFKYEKLISRSVKVPLNRNQYITLVSFAFNIGERGFADSTLLKKLNTGDYESVPTQLRRWKFDNGRIVQGLINRREKEIIRWHLGNGD